MKNTVSKMRNIPDGMNNKLDIDDEKSTKLEDTSIVQNKTQRENKIFFLKWKHICDLLDDIKQSKIYVIGVPEKKSEKNEKMMAKIVLHLIATISPKSRKLRKF